MLQINFSFVFLAPTRITQTINVYIGSVGAENDFDTDTGKDFFWGLTTYKKLESSIFEESISIALRTAR